jgi:type 1 glutamine amidotransferase
MSGRTDKIEVFVVVKGHPFSRDGLEAMLRAASCEPTMVDQPAAAVLLNPDHMRRYDAILFYDMPGLDFGVPADERPEFVTPPNEFTRGFEALLAQGKGIVMLHHAIAGWPAWPPYAQAIGGQFLYRSAIIDGSAMPESGYLPDIAYTVRAAQGGHPVLANLPERFELVDELYLHQIFPDPYIVPLLYLEDTIAPERFQSPRRAVQGLAACEDEPWRPGPVNPLLAWAKPADQSPLVYIQPGDAVQTYANPHYRQLVGNALRWVSSAGAREWASDPEHTTATA